MKSPVTGSIAEVNESQVDLPELVYQDPTGEGWFYKVAPADPAEMDDLLDETAYDNILAGLE